MTQEGKHTSLEKIYEAAIVEFSNNGFDGARIDRIAERAGVNKAMIYYHYNGKEALYQAVLTDVVDNVYSKLTSTISDNTDPVTNLDNLVMGYSQIIGNLPEVYLRIMIREIASGGVYFRAISLPRLITPMIDRIDKLFFSGREKGLLSDVNPIFTLLHIVGANLFFNIIRITLKGEPIHEMIFSGDYPAAYGENLLRILKEGVLKRGQNDRG